MLTEIIVSASLAGAALLVSFLSWRAAAASATAAKRSVEVSESMERLALQQTTLAERQVLDSILGRLTAATQQAYDVWLLSSWFADKIAEGVQPPDFRGEIDRFMARIVAFNREHKAIARMVLAGDKDAMDQVVGMFSYLEDATRAAGSGWQFEGFLSRYRTTLPDLPDSRYELAFIIDRAYRILSSRQETYTKALGETERLLAELGTPGHRALASPAA